MISRNRMHKDDFVLFGVKTSRPRPSETGHLFHEGELTEDSADKIDGEGAIVRVCVQYPRESVKFSVPVVPTRKLSYLLDGTFVCSTAVVTADIEKPIMCMKSRTCRFLGCDRRVSVFLLQ